MIVTDRTGGARKGVFEGAIQKLNLLEPELVLSVGDLIEGYTENRARLTKEWDEFDELVRGLRAPFFYVAGNHDLSNDVMRDVWLERYGKTEYSFVYKNVLFVCLNSMDGGHHQVSVDQVHWLEGVLSRHRDVRWTLLFLHTPLWDTALGRGEKTEETAWSPIEAALGDRKYTVFAGHHHRYVKHEHKSHKLFTLATTGGSSSLRGPAYGEFDHVMWVTMTADGPQIANLLLDGIWDENVRAAGLRSFQYAVMSEGALEPSVLYHRYGFSRGSSTVRVKNDRDVPFEVKLKSPKDHGYLITPPELEIDAPPNSLSDHEFQVSSNVKTAAELVKLPLRWTASSREPDGQRFRISGETALSIVKLGRVGRTGRRIVPDGKLDDWPALGTRVERPLQILRKAKAWQGRDDNRFRIGLAADREHLYVAVDVVDDQVESQPTQVPWEQDGIEVRVDARPDPLRAHSRGAHDGQRFIAVVMSPSPAASEVWFSPRHFVKPEGVEASCVQKSTGFVTEIAISRRVLDAAAGGKADRVRINVAVDDRDRDGQSQNWWWPDWRTPEDVPGSGTFELAP